MDPKDVAVTGAGGSEKSVSWLYDYEEQKGRLTFSHEWQCSLSILDHLAFQSLLVR